MPKFRVHRVVTETHELWADSAEAAIGKSAGYGGDKFLTHSECQVACTQLDEKVRCEVDDNGQVCGEVAVVLHEESNTRTCRAHATALLGAA